MAPSGTEDRDDERRRYEYRVWGRRKRVRKRLERMADRITTSTTTDCYFLSEERAVNAKVRTGSLKIKRRVGRARGFEVWTSSRHRSKEGVPAPFDELVDELGLHRKPRRSAADLPARVEKLDPDHPTTPVFVTKRRTHYRIGDLRAEVSELTIEDAGEVLHSVAIEGEDLDALVALRKELGLKGEDNVAVHVALQDAI